jgi:hypothetical protein
MIGGLIVDIYNKYIYGFMESMLSSAYDMYKVS